MHSIATKYCLKFNEKYREERLDIFELERHIFKSLSINLI